MSWALQGAVYQTSLSGANIADGVGPNARADAQVILEGIKKTVTKGKTKESNYVVWQRQLGSGRTVEAMTLPRFTGLKLQVFSAPVVWQHAAVSRGLIAGGVVLV